MKELPISFQLLFNGDTKMNKTELLPSRLQQRKMIYKQLAMVILERAVPRIYIGNGNTEVGSLGWWVRKLYGS